MVRVDSKSGVQSNLGLTPDLGLTPYLELTVQFASSGLDFLHNRYQIHIDAIEAHICERSKEFNQKQREILCETPTFGQMFDPDLSTFTLVS